MLRMTASCFLLVCLTTTSVAAHAESLWLDYPDDGSQIGAGWNAATYRPTNTICIQGWQEHTEKSQTSFSTVGIVYDKEQLTHGLNISASEQAKFLSFGESAKLSYVLSQDISSEKTTVAVYAFVQNGPHNLVVAPNSQEIRLTPHYEQLWSTNRPEFYKECGTHYVNAFKDGGELIGLLTWSDLTEGQKSSASAALSGNVFGVSASINIANTLNQLSAIKSYSLQARRSGGWGNPIATDQNSLMLSLQNLSQDAATAPHHFAFEAVSYSELQHETEAPDPNLSSLDMMISRLWRLSALKTDFLLVDSRRSDYIFNWGISGSDFDARLQSIQVAVNSTTAALKSCFAAQNCQGQLASIPSPFDWEGYLPLKKGSFAADQILRASASQAQAAVAAFDQQRQARLRLTATTLPGIGSLGCNTYNGNRVFTQWSEPTWLNNVWPVVATFQSALQGYPAALQATMAEVRFASPWRQFCRSAGSDIDCLLVQDLRSREATIPISSAGHDFSTNGTGSFPGGPATQCNIGTHAFLTPNID